MLGWKSSSVAMATLTVIGISELFKPIMKASSISSKLVPTPALRQRVIRSSWEHSWYTRRQPNAPADPDRVLLPIPLSSPLLEGTIGYVEVRGWRGSRSP